jgi:hypothetical protein
MGNCIHQGKYVDDEDDGHHPGPEAVLKDSTIVAPATDYVLWAALRAP